MSRYWRIDAPIGHNYENSGDALQVAISLHYAFLTASVIHSTILSNNIRCVEVYDSTVKCRIHGKDHNVFVLIESTDAVCEANIVSFLATQFLGRSMIPGVKDGIGELRFSLISRTEYESVQVAYHADMHSRNGIITAHSRNDIIAAHVA
jgi:hypothetical protein